MKILIIFVFFIAANADEVLDTSIYKPESEVYTGKNDIVAIHVPIYMNKTVEDVIFIVEENDGVYKGLYDAVKMKYSMEKVLENGKCITSDKDNVYFGGSDGIYTYNFETNEAEKYGSIEVEVKAIQKHTEKDLFYIIAEGQLNKVHGTNMEIVESVNNVQEIVLDKDNNLFFYEKASSSKLWGLYKEETFKPKVIVNDKFIDIEDIPEFKKIKLARTLASKEGILSILDNRIYRFFANGTSVATDYIFENAPTVLFVDAGIIQLYGYYHHLYLFNVLESILLGITTSVGNFFESFQS